MVAALGRAVFRSVRFYAIDVLTALIVAHLKHIGRTLKTGARQGVCLCSLLAATSLYHVGATLCASRHHGQVCGVVVFRVHGCLVAYFSTSDGVEGFLGCHREIPAPGAEEFPTGLISVEEHKAMSLQTKNVKGPILFKIYFISVFQQ